MMSSETPVNGSSLDGAETPSSAGSRSPRACARVMSKNFIAKTGVEVSFYFPGDYENALCRSVLLLKSVAGIYCLGNHQGCKISQSFRTPLLMAIL